MYISISDHKWVESDRLRLTKSSNNKQEHSLLHGLYLKCYNKILTWFILIPGMVNPCIRLLDSIK